jgi:hypothetical protein
MCSSSLWSGGWTFSSLKQIRNSQKIDNNQI